MAARARARKTGTQEFGPWIEESSKKERKETHNDRQHNADMIAITLSSALQRLLDLDSSHFWPASYKSAPQWVAICCILFSRWTLDFLIFRTPLSIKRAEKTRLLRVRELQRSVLCWHKDEMKKAKTVDSETTTTKLEAKRLLELLYDDTYECRTSSYGALEHNTEIETLFKVAASSEMRKTIKYTNIARDFETAAAAGDVEEIKLAKLVASHESGEKLNSAIVFAEDANTKLGPGFVDMALIAEAKSLAHAVFKSQSSDRLEVLKLIRPALPFMCAGALSTMVNSALRGYFHSIGNWGSCIELAAKGQQEEAVQALFALWLGHMVIEFVQRLDTSYMLKAEILFKKRVKAGVLGAMLSQDYEYFEKNQAGVLQDRLNRDSNELGENLVRFPQRTLSRVCWLAVNVVFIYCSCPTALLFPAISPIFVMIPLQYYCFKVQAKSHASESKVTETAVASTSEIIRGTLTVAKMFIEPLPMF